ncbi:MAG: calcium-binding protein [Pleurocapsa sp.]
MGYQGGAPSFVDLDKDGDLDAFTNFNGSIKYYENDGSGNFAENSSANPLAAAQVSYYGAPNFADLDKDGDLDAFTNYNGEVLFYENQAGDFVTGSENPDDLKAGDSDDIIDGMAGDDTISGGAGNDQINGGADKDRITGDMGNDQIDGGEADDFLQGGDENDTVSGGADDDFIFGESGNDSLTGDAGNDVIIGGEGDDFIDGGVGIDRMTGLEGSDTFAIQDGDVNNIIYDFNDGSDLFAIQSNNFGEFNITDLFDGSGTDIVITAGSTNPLTSQITYGGDVLATVYGVSSSDLDMSDFTEVDLGLPDKTAF